MPSLKDLRNRIDSVKATQQDHQGHADGRGGQAAPCAGSGRGRAALRRAHATPCSPSSPAARRRRRPRRRCCAGTGKRRGAPAGGHDRRPRPVRRLQLDDRAARARPMPTSCAPQGKTVKILMRRQEGPSSSCARDYGQHDHRSRRSRPAVRELDFDDAAGDRRRPDHRDVRGRRVRRRRRSFYTEFKSRDHAERRRRSS